MSVVSEILTLRELIAALDRRFPQVHRACEAAIALDAAALRVAALDGIARLEGRAVALEAR